jgi:hypothetical protein
MGSVIPFLEKSFPSYFPNHCLATAKQVKLDMVAPVTNPPKKILGKSNSCINKLIVSISIKPETPPCAFVAYVFWS